MPTFVEQLGHVADTLKGLVREDGLEYLERDERYEIHPDLSLRAFRVMKLRCLADDPIACLPTRWGSDVPAPSSDIGFSVEAEGRTAFSVPSLEEGQSYTDKEEVRRSSRIVCLVPPLAPGDTVVLKLSWSWPRYWSKLERAKQDFVRFRLLHPTRRLRVSICTHRDLPMRAGLTVAARHAGAKSTTVGAGRFVCHEFTYRKPSQGEYHFDCTVQP